MGQQGVAQLAQIQKLAQQLDEANVVRQKVNARILQQIIKMKEDQTSTAKSINKLTIRLEDNSSTGLTVLEKLEKEIQELKKENKMAAAKCYEESTKEWRRH